MELALSTFESSLSPG